MTKPVAPETRTTSAPIVLKDSTIQDFINFMQRSGGDPQSCVALLAAAYLFIYDHGTEPGTPLETCLESFAATVITLDASRKSKS